MPPTPLAAHRHRPRAFDDSPGALPVEWLVFKLAGQDYAIPLARVCGIHAHETPIWVARSPSPALGLMPLGGGVMPVIDLRLHVGVAHPTATALTAVIELQHRGSACGVVVDQVGATLSLRADELRALPAAVQAEPDEPLQATARIAGRHLLLLNIDKLLKYPAPCLGLGHTLH